MTTAPGPPAGQPISAGYLGPPTDAQREELEAQLAEMFPDMDPSAWRPKGTPTLYQREPAAPPPFPGGEPAPAGPRAGAPGEVGSRAHPTTA